MASESKRNQFINNSLIPKKMLHRLPTVLAQVKACNTSKDLLNEIRQMIYSLYRENEINKKII